MTTDDLDIPALLAEIRRLRVLLGEVGDERG